MDFLTATYDDRLVAASLAGALMAAYTALDLASRIRTMPEVSRYAWLVAGAIALGTGIWSTHLLGTLALALPIDIGFRADICALAWLVGVLASLVALALLIRQRLTRTELFGASLLLAGTILALHYLSIGSMQIRPPIVYDRVWVALSILVAIAACNTSLRIAFSRPSASGLSAFGRKSAGALLLAIGVVGTHYVGIQAAQFPATSTSAAASELDWRWLALLICNTTVLLSATLLIAIALDRRMHRRTAQLVRSLDMANLQLHHASRHDPLTQLGNRPLLRERLEQAIMSAHANRQRAALLHIGLDRFKQINDSLGHDAADTLLTRLAQAMSQSAQAGDTVARVGGDEFLILMTGDVGSRSLHRHCERLLALIRDIHSGQTRLSGSIGVARYPIDAYDAAGLITASHMAMYSAKQAGRDQYAFFTSELAQSVERDVTIRSELSEAIDCGQIQPYYQPKYDVRTRRLVGAEALARWHHPADGFVPPDRFIAVAERSRQISSLQNCMLRAICADIRDWRSQGLHVPPIAFNLSASCLRDPALATTIAAILAEFGLSPRDLICEITETAAVPELQQALHTLGKLRSQGIRISIDDFGTGLSSMSYLRDLPIDQLKIDRAFVARLGNNVDSGNAIVRSIIDLAHSLKLDVVAEGVELESQLSTLAELNCDEVQGYLFSPAVEADAFAAGLNQTSQIRPRSIH
ncbi:EAL domain-containing protein [uncultured Salinisphaera sp.]|jgi:diguanylate cyclase (GGDEF)-like protein|uniref:putative bifunctional diguanylate cyclase/phosphodiesterase n=1 Tax=uncultured Salinisphaera sp. TaxID=359372 RepID=UPI0032B209BC